MKLNLIKTIAIAGAGIAAIAVTPAMADSIKYATLGPAKAGYNRIMFPVMDKMEKDSGGKLKIGRFPGRQLVKSPKALYPSLLKGVYDMTLFGFSDIPKKFPLGNVYALPGTFMSAEESAAVMWRLYDKGLLTVPNDVVPVAFFSNGNAGLYLAKKVSSFSEVKGKKIANSGAALDLIRQFGASPVRMGITSVASSMTSGVVDGSLSGWEALRQFQIGPAAKSFIQAPFGVNPFIMAIRRDAYDSLSAESRAAIDKNRGAGLSTKIAASYTRGSNAAKKAAAKVGNIIKADKDVSAALEQVNQAWLAKHGAPGKKLYDALRAEIAAVRK